MMSPAFSSQDDPLPFVFVPGRETLRPGCALRPLPFPHFVSPAERKRSFRIHSFSADGEKCKSSDIQRVRRIKRSWCQSKPREKPPSPCRRWGTLGRRKLSRRYPDGQGERTRKANRASCTAEEPDASPLTGSRPRRRIRP